MKGIIMGAGKASRLYPISLSVTKHLLPIYDKPMIYYPLSTLMVSGIRNILIIGDYENIPLYKKLLGDGSQIGIKISYESQPKPKGIADAFVLGEEFIGQDYCALVLGDNLFHGVTMGSNLANYVNLGGATIFAYKVSDPENYGVVEFEDYNNEVVALSIEEKPKIPKSSYAIPGLYFYDNQVINFAKSLKPSKRGELEISDINKLYLNKNQLRVQLLPRGTAWLDTGTPSSLFDAASYIKVIQDRQGSKISCIEEIAFRNGWIDKSQLNELADGYKNEYGNYLRELSI
jgi:glucose-1-phosphate thymidylyltransferase